jgi:hypothetical protein
LNQSFDSEELFPEPRELLSCELSENDQSLDENHQRNVLEDQIKDSGDVDKTGKITQEEPSEAKGIEVKAKRKFFFTPEQDKTILNLHKMFGGNWKKISSFMGGLSPNAVKNRYYKKLRDRSQKMNSDQKESTLNNDQTHEKKVEIDKREQLVNLYQKMTEIENYIKNTKLQIQQLVKKSMPLKE